MHLQSKSETATGMSTMISQMLLLIPEIQLTVRWRISYIIDGSRCWECADTKWLSWMCWWAKTIQNIFIQLLQDRQTSYPTTQCEPQARVLGTMRYDGMRNSDLGVCSVAWPHQHGCDAHVSKTVWMLKHWLGNNGCTGMNRTELDWLCWVDIPCLILSLTVEANIFKPGLNVRHLNPCLGT